MPNRLRYFLGKRPVEFNGVGIHSPTIDEIDEIGEVQYNIFLTIATFNKEVVFRNLLSLPDEDYEKIVEFDVYDLFLEVPVIVERLEEALSFFTNEKVEYYNRAFLVDNAVFIDKTNYLEVAKIIKESNGIIEDQKKVNFKNERARQMYEKMLKMRAKHKKNDAEDSLMLKDMLSILCNAGVNGINIFNVGQLRIYQVYEHFERLNIRENHTRTLQVWANGHLGEDSKLPEWIVKSKL